MEKSEKVKQVTQAGRGREEATAVRTGTSNTVLTSQHWICGKRTAHQEGTTSVKALR